MEWNGMENQIAIGLIVATAAFAIGLCTHILIWRIRRPAAYPLWLMAIFAAAFLLALGGAELAGLAPLKRPFGLISGALLYAVLVAVYGLSYGGIADFSPSAEILREVANAMPDGIPPEMLRLPDLTDGWLIDNRINHLVASGLLRESEGRLEVTDTGRALISATVIYRRALLQTRFGKG
jgi:hypothetical protein